MLQMGWTSILICVIVTFGIDDMSVFGLDLDLVWASSSYTLYIYSCFLHLQSFAPLLLQHSCCIFLTLAQYSENRAYYGQVCIAFVEVFV
jgi:hypothetical protein